MDMQLPPRQGMMPQGMQPQSGGGLGGLDPQMIEAMKRLIQMLMMQQQQGGGGMPPEMMLGGGGGMPPMGPPGMPPR